MKIKPLARCSSRKWRRSCSRCVISSSPSPRSTIRSRRASPRFRGCALRRYPNGEERCIAQPVRCKPSRGRAARHAPTHGATTSIWSMYLPAGFARKPARSTPSSKHRTSSSRPRRARSFTSTRVAACERRPLECGDIRQQHRARCAVPVEAGIDFPAPVFYPNRRVHRRRRHGHCGELPCIRRRSSFSPSSMRRPCFISWGADFWP